MPETIFLFVYKLQEGYTYRHDQVFIVGGEKPREGLTASQLPTAMARLVDFANQNDNLNELHKAAILHFALAYYHPYFDGNGRTARLFHLWYLVQHGYPAALFTPFSHYIAESKAGYYRAYEQIESNALITGYTDVTPFPAYFCENVYGRLQFGTDASHADMQIYNRSSFIPFIPLREHTDASNSKCSMITILSFRIAYISGRSKDFN